MTSQEARPSVVGRRTRINACGASMWSVLSIKKLTRTRLARTPSEA